MVTINRIGRTTLGMRGRSALGMFGPGTPTSDEEPPDIVAQCDIGCGFPSPMLATWSLNTSASSCLCVTGSPANAGSIEIGYCAAQSSGTKLVYWGYAGFKNCAVDLKYIYLKGVYYCAASEWEFSTWGSTTQSADPTCPTRTGSTAINQPAWITSGGLADSDCDGFTATGHGLSSGYCKTEDGSITIDIDLAII